MSSIKSFFKWLGDILDDIIVYLAAVVGILFSKAISVMNTGEAIQLDFGLVRVGTAMLIAFVFLNQDERLDGSTAEQKAQARAGRRRKFRARVVAALGQGFMWSQVTGLGG